MSPVRGASVDDFRRTRSSEPQRAAQPKQPSTAMPQEDTHSAHKSEHKVSQTSSKASGEGSHAKSGRPRRRRSSQSSGSWWFCAAAVVALSGWAFSFRSRGMDALKEGLSSVNTTRLEKDYGVRVPVLLQSAGTPPRPGAEARERGLRPKHPVLIVPGFVTTKLEVWQGVNCSTDEMRARIWGSAGMPRSLLADKDCWLQLMSLDPVTGLDPEGIRLRAHEGLDGVDFFVPGYHVWAKLIEACADLGYGPVNLAAENYDWRLSIVDLEQRDRYLSVLRARVELLHQMNGEKVVVLAHSWGDNVWRTFMRWATAEDAGWVERHVAAYVNIAGTVLGVAKSVTSLLSGETRDTAVMGLVGDFLSDKFVPRDERVKLFRTWGSGLGMLPIGGTAAWGNATWAPDDTPEMTERNLTHGVFLTEVRLTETSESERRQHSGFWRESVIGRVLAWVPGLAREPEGDVKKETRHHDAPGAVEVLMDAAGDTPFKERVVAHGAVFSNPVDSGCALDKEDARTWHVDPMRCALPDAPSLQLFNLYGVGLPTERSYQYVNYRTQRLREKAARAAGESADHAVPWKLDLAASAPAANASGLELESGCRLSDGDGTVPLLSLGALPARHWRRPRLNPSGMRVVSREYQHKPLPSLADPRGGPLSADHVNILANVDMLSDVLAIAAGRGADVEDRFLSDVRSVAARMAVSE